MPQNLFENAPLAPVRQKARKRPETETVELAGVEKLAAVRVLLKALQDAEERLSTTVRQEIIDRFVEKGLEQGKRPANFKAVDGLAEASCQLQLRSSPLNYEEVNLLEQRDIPTEEVHVREETYVINPAYRNDQALLKRVSAALSKVQGLPTDFIQLQRETQHKASPETLDALFRQGRETVQALLCTVATPACKPTLEVDFATAFEIAANEIPQPADPNEKRESWGAALAPRQDEPIPL